MHTIRTFYAHVNHLVAPVNLTVSPLWPYHVHMAKAKKTKQPESIRVYLSEEQKKKIIEKANRLGLSDAAYMRQLALAEVEKTQEAQPQH